MLVPSKTIAARSTSPALLIVIFVLAGIAAASPLLAWSPPANITRLYGNADVAGGIIAHDSSGRLHSVFTRSSQELYYVLVDGDMRTVISYLAQGITPCVVADGLGKVHALWAEGSDIRYKQWNGVWGAALPTVSSGTGGCTDPQVCVDSANNLHAVWAKGGNVWYNRLSAVSGVWDGPQQLTSTNDVQSTFPPRVAAVGTSPVIVCGRKIGSPVSVWFLSKESGTWSSLQLPSSGTAASTGDIDAASDGNVYATWDDNSDVWCARRIGGSWSSIIAIRTGTPTSLAPRVATSSSSKVGIVWKDNGPGFGDVFGSTWNGGSWSSPATVTGLAAGTCIFPEIIRDASGYQHIAYCNGNELWWITDRPDATPPPPVSNLAAASGDNQNVLSWTNPLAVDLAKVRIVFRTDHYPTSASDGTVLIDRAAVSGTDSVTHTGLTNGVTYYYAVYVGDEVPNYSAASLVWGRPHLLSCNDAKGLADGQPINLKDRVISTMFTSGGYFYVQDPERMSGIRVVNPGAGYSVGRRINITGTMGSRMQNGYVAERQITGATLSLVSSGTAPRPLFLNCASVGGPALSPTIPGVLGATTGLNNMGLLVKIAGKVTGVFSNFVYVDDGTGVHQDSGIAGVMVECPSTPTVVPGNIVSAVGICGAYVPIGWAANRSYIRLKNSSDLALISSNLGSVSGYVRNSGGVGLSGITVATEDGEYVTTTAGNGSFSLPSVIAGRYILMATYPGYSTDSEEIVVTPGGAVTCNFTIDQNAGTISGIVRDYRSVAIPGALVTTNVGGYYAVTNSSGSYTMSYVVTGTYNVTVSAPGYQTQTQYGVPVGVGGITYANFILATGP